MNRWKGCLLACSGLLVVATFASCGSKRQASSKTFSGVPASSPEGSVDYLDARYGFRDLEFGSAPTPDMKLAKKQDTDLTQSYVRPRESMDLGSGKADVVRYVYFKDRLTSVMIEIHGQDNNRAVLQELWAAHGPTFPKQAPMHTWHGERTVLSYRENPDGSARVVIWSRPMMAPVVAASKARGSR